MKDAERWMAHALELARKGEALASPNPMVGAVVVREGRAVGEGFHTYDGFRHAEIVALEAAGAAARGATLYVTLEPCCQQGRTGPCTEAIVAAGIRRVVAALRDPNPAVSSKGFARLRRAGIRVEIGEAEREASKLNEAFARWIRTGLPLVTLKAALSLDGQIAEPAAKRRARSVTWITSRESRAAVQRLRHASDVVLTGIGTVLADDPRLTDRTGLPRRRPLLRAVLDSRLRLPLDSRVVRSAAGDVLVFTTARAAAARARALRRAGAEVVAVGARGGRVDLAAVLQELGRRQFLSVLIEGGSRLNAAALAGGFVDKLIFFVAPQELGPGVPFLAGGSKAMRKIPPFREWESGYSGPDFYLAGYLRDVYRDH